MLAQGVQQHIHHNQQILRDCVNALTVPCPYCGQPFHRVAAHAHSAHRVTVADFREQFYYTTAAQAAAKKLKHLYSGRYDRYIEQTSDFRTGQVSYVTHDAAQPWTADWDKLFTLRKYVSHIRGTRTYGVQFKPYTTTVLIFDLDYYDEEARAIFFGVNDINLSLKQIGFQSHQIHLIDSANKGYHIALYFDKPVSITALLKMAKLVLADVQHDWPPDWTDALNIELRPESPIGGRGVRLPLGLHRETGQITEYLDKDWHCLWKLPFPNPFDYLFKIQPVPSEEFFQHIYPNVKKARVRPTGQSTNHQPLRAADNEVSLVRGAKTATNQKRSPVKNHRYTRDELTGLYSHGLERPGTRHNVTLGLAIWLKEQSKTEAEVQALLLKWTRTKLNGYSKTAEDIIETELNRIVHWVFHRVDATGRKGAHLTEPVHTPWLLTDSDVETIVGYDYLTLKEQVTMMELFRIRRHYGSEAYYPQGKIAHRTGFSVRTIRNHQSKFLRLGLIKRTYHRPLLGHSNKYSIRDFRSGYNVAFEVTRSHPGGGSAATRGGLSLLITALKHFLPLRVLEIGYSHYIYQTYLRDATEIRFNIAFHPLIQQHLSNPIHTPTHDHPEKKRVGRQFFDDTMVANFIRFWQMVRKWKRQHSAKVIKAVYNQEGYYLRC